jgi:hypothetical protein
MFHVYNFKPSNIEKNIEIFYWVAYFNSISKSSNHLIKSAPERRQVDILSVVSSNKPSESLLS